MSESKPENQTPEEIQAEIERARANLADTVGQLGERLDERKRQAKTGAMYAGAAIGAVVVLVVVVKIVKRVRS